jgi:hypothetical protein
MQNQNCIFRLFVGNTNTEQANIYEKKYRSLLKIVQTKLGNIMFHDAKLITTENQEDVIILIRMSTSSYLKNLDLSMSRAEINDELEDTRREIKIRCTRVLQSLHKSIGEQVKEPVQDDDRIQVFWIEDYAFFDFD